MDDDLKIDDKNIGCSIDKPLIVADPFFENTEKLTPRRVLETELEKWKRRAKAFQEGYRDKSFEVTALEIQLMDLRAHGADKVTARQNESLRTKLVAACIERNERKRIAEAARDFIWEPENWEAYQDSKESNSAAWPPEFLLLAQAVEEAYGPMPVENDAASAREGAQK